MSSRAMKRKYDLEVEEPYIKDDQNVMEILSDADSDDDESDSDAETRKKNPLLKKFFEQWHRDLTDINDSKRKWNCPACQKQYVGLQALMNHAKTISTRRKRHRDLADLMDEELRRRGTTVVPAGESFGKWKGLTVEEKDHEIVWPPMVVIRNTRHENDENKKWIGMGTQELRNYFSSYDAVRAKHSYGPDGHRGMSLLIFEESAIGYFEAERLHMPSISHH